MRRIPLVTVDLGDSQLRSWGQSFDSRLHFSCRAAVSGNVQIPLHKIVQALATLDVSDMKHRVNSAWFYNPCLVPEFVEGALFF